MGIFRLRDLEDVGLSRGRLRGMLRRGEVDRLGRGLYCWGDEITELHTVAAVSARVPGAVICLLSALSIHRIGTQLPADVWIAIDNKARKPHVTDLPIRVVRFSGPMLHYGIEEREVQAVKIRITSPARTIVDCFRYRNKIGLDVALEALKDGLQQRKANVAAIMRAADVCNASTIIRPYLEAVLA